MRAVCRSFPVQPGPVGALILASLIWGTADVAGKLALVSFPPATLAAMRFGIALAILWPLSRRCGGIRVPMRITAPLGVLGVGLTFLFQNFGLARTTATNASLLQGTTPVLALLLAAVMLRERLDIRRVMAVAAALTGVAVITLGGDGLRAPGFGDLLVIVSAGCFSAFIVLGRRAFPVYGTLPVLAGMAAWGFAALLPVALVESWTVRPAQIEIGAIALLLYLGAGCSALTYGLWGYALRRIEASRAATFDALVPVVGLTAAVVILHEAPPLWHAVGGALVVLGVWMSADQPGAAVDISRAAVPVGAPA